MTVLKKPLIGEVVLNNSKNTSDIVYGARSIQKQLGTISRQTEDYDIFSSNPKVKAKGTEKKLDKLYGFNYFYTKPGMHKGTYKVKSIGMDFKKNTKDDEGIVDYTKTPKTIPKSINYGGINYRIIKEEIKAKKKSLSDKEFVFRHKKDRGDLILINTVLSASNPMRPNIPRTKLFETK